MVSRTILFAGLSVLLAAVAAAADDRPLFNFKGEIAVPGVTVRLDARCAGGQEALNCRVESVGPSGQAFQFEGRLRLTPPDRRTSEDPGGPNLNTPRWF